MLTLNGHRQCRTALAGMAFAALALLAGCGLTRPAVAPSPGVALPSDPSLPVSKKQVFPERMAEGYTLVLPGAGGESTLDHGIVVGLRQADVRSAVELHNWAIPNHQLVADLRGLDRNRAEAQKVAAKIVAYQQEYPGRPVNLVGYSGGAGVAVLALEALPPDCQVTRAILLAPTLAYDYDMQRALSHTEHGIANFYSPLDVPVLMVISTAVGTTEGRHTVAAGAVGFQTPKSLDAAQRAAYEARLSQHEYQIDMLWEGHGGGHFGWSSPTFVARHVAPLIAAGVSVARRP